ncbi:MAG TPA: sugar ABC transporter substrate-binding protein [Treponema sp.]|nr:sugar ABC transporter substrate-binding protein [Treponema sp.]HPC71007.1 sugar ABC transporter substrate-binding protein [Treponema sp.]HRS03444.1 sugar ABC transporter substrate-binding protein [Treponema sp.]HRU27960.1 sugar ABC transporter substrate-binding protein [Treponema sp.]
MKKIVTVLLVLGLAGSMAFASGSQQQTTGSGGGKAPLIGLAMPETHVERWQKDGAALKADAEAKGYRAEVTYADADQSKQNQQIQDFLTKGAKLLIIGSVNEGVVSAVSDAAKEKVIVIAYDRLITGTADYDYYITFDNFKVGQFQGKALETALNLPAATKDKPKYITLFAGSPTDNNANVFFDGAMDILKKYVDSGVLKIVGPAPLSSSDKANFTRITTENWRADVAKARMENLLNNDAKNVVLDGILAPNDTLARAIIEACSSDAKYANGKLPVVTGQDGELASIKAIKDGKQYMTVFKDTRNLAKAAIELADALLKGQTPNIAGARLDTTSYNTGKKVVKSYLLEPVVVTKDNYKQIMIDSGYYKASDLE